MTYPETTEAPFNEINPQQFAACMIGWKVTTEDTQADPDSTIKKSWHIEHPLLPLYRCAVHLLYRSVLQLTYKRANQIQSGKVPSTSIWLCYRPFSATPRQLQYIRLPFVIHLQARSPVIHRSFDPSPWDVCGALPRETNPTASRSTTIGTLVSDRFLTYAIQHLLKVKHSPSCRPTSLCN